MIRPERDEPLDERPRRGHALSERGPRLADGELREPLSRLPLVLIRPCPAPALTLALVGHPESAERVADLRRRGAFGRLHRRRTSVELRFQPAARVADRFPFVAAGTEAESIERTKCGIHH